MLVVLGVLALVMVLGIPALQNFIIRSRSEGFAREASTLMQRTRLEAIKMNRAGVVHLDPANRRLVAFIDANRDHEFNPDPDEPPRTSDYVLGRLPLPSNVDFVDPDGFLAEDSVDGFTTVKTDLGDVQAAYFRSDGSVEDLGAFRIGDVRENFLEIRVDPSASGRIEILKYREDDDKFHSSGDPSSPDYEPWKWN